MGRQTRKKIALPPIKVAIEKLSHEGRGIAFTEGKTQFVEGALPGEQVMASYLQSRSRFDELKTVEVLVPSAERVVPPCEHATLCGGCSLQHMAPEAQIALKQTVLKDQFTHFGGVEPEQWVDPLVGPELGYRRKARLGVRYVIKREEVLIGFREKHSNFLTALSHCEVLDKRVGHKIEALKELVRSLTVYQQVPQIEVAMGDDAVALVIRHMAPMSEQDLQLLRNFSEEHQFTIYLQPKGPDTVHRLWPESGTDRLHYMLPDYDLKMAFHPLDFTQVNADINKNMINRALEWLAPEAGDRVLDLFCGLGNFTLPLARKAAAVVGVEGDDAMVVRGRENALANEINNVRFYGADLQSDFTKAEWAAEGFDKILIDPPRSGALDVVNYLPAFGASRIVYVSCNPATLARDAGVLVAHGYRLVKAGVMDMFPHTTHVESIALFERN
ncbi:MAG: 23S rRNA (uracil(1939)-C(5))-methyltransferase RlmD [Hahellaceae bacterium]|nr:23S rRNA (uracil(1939)-C(5))-methyltransferase RlmD [Hahellaceae bacterium]